MLGFRPCNPTVLFLVRFYKGPIQKNVLIHADKLIIFKYLWLKKINSISTVYQVSPSHSHSIFQYWKAVSAFQGSADFQNLQFSVPKLSIQYVMVGFAIVF